MREPFAILALLATAGVVSAQDSVSKLRAVPGDSLDSHDTLEQVNDFIVDQTIVSSSWDNKYGMAPLVKSSEQSSTPSFFNNLISAQALSKDQRSGVPFVRTSYDLWSAPGFGINHDPTKNDPGTPVDTTGKRGNQFGLVISDFGTAANSMNNIVSGVVNFETTLPSRLYVSRVVTAVNSPNYTCNLSQFGAGSIDSSGQAVFRADSFGTTDGCGRTAIVDNNYFRVSNLCRTNGVLNVIDAAGGSHAACSVHVISADPTVQATPTILPTGLGGPRLIGSSWASDWFLETVGSSFAHLPAGIVETRGNVSYTQRNFPSVLGASSARGTAGQLGIDSAHSSTDEVFHMIVWGITAAGGVSGNRALTLPATITDPDDGWTTPAAPAIEFVHHGSQTSFRGGNGQVAVGLDVATETMLAAAVIDHGTGPFSTVGDDDHDRQAIAVARVTAGGVAWTLAAHNDGTTGVGGTGKAIRDGKDGAVIGRLVSLSTVTGGTPLGPSIGPPMIDSAGNVYFVAAIERFLVGGTSDFDNALVRAVLDPSDFSYQLEEVLEVGWVFPGRNSGRNYQVRFIDLADSNSISSSTAFSGNISSVAFNNLDPASLATADSRTLGGLLLNVQIVYDADDDGDFDLQTGTGGDPTSDDEDYRVALYLSGGADCNENGVPDDYDIFRGNSTDLNGNGIPDECEGDLGDNYCVANPNSTGFPALISASGSASIADNDVTLRSSPVPNQPFIFFFGPNQIQVPFGNGFLCTGGGLTRILPPGLASGQIAIRAVDLPSVGITVAGAKNFQCWYRDPAAGGAFFNTSDGLHVIFVP